MFIAQLCYSCVHNEIARCGLFNRQSITLTIGLSNNRQSGKCAIGQALIIMVRDHKIRS